ncbi:MAG: TRAP transporter small permease subunit [Deltaproteobacteria bacterium]|nr:TRAP transporter small permease subunit [Deltaproteobacteria bacterium]
MKLLKMYIRLVDRLSQAVGLMVSVLMPAMVVVLAYEVIARYVFKNPTIWVYDLAIFMFGYIGLLAGAYVLKNRQHVNVDILYDRFSPRQKAISESLTGILFFFLIVLVIKYSFENALFAIENGEATATEWGPPVGHFKLMIPIGAFLLLLQGLANWIRAIYRALTDKELDV